MTQYLEDHIPVVKYEGLNSTKDGTLSGDFTFSGDNIFSGTNTFTGGSVQNTEVVTTTNVITAAESGKTFYLSAAAGFVSTLPTAAAGLNFKFVVKTAPTSNGYTIVGTPVAKIQGTVGAGGANTEANGIVAADEDNVIFVANQAVVGDWVEFNSDGTNWYVSGEVSVVAGLTANT